MSMKPILFNTPMTQSVRDDIKTETRRVVREPYYIYKPDVCVRSGLAMHRGVNATHGMSYPDRPYESGDILYVPEAWKCYAIWDALGYEVEFRDGEHVYFDFTDLTRAKKWAKYLDKPVNHWQSPYFMPKEAARIFLRVTNVRVERLQDITSEDILKEGVRPKGLRPGGCKCAWAFDGCFEEPCANRNAYLEMCHSKQFAELWDKTAPKHPNKFKRYPYYWADNPWVWVIQFERISREEAMK